MTEATFATGFAGPGGEIHHIRAVIYRMGETEFATDVKQVQEIVRPTRLVRPAKISDNVEGIIKRRGRLVPVVDLRKRLGLRLNASSPETCVVVVRLPIGPVGFIVDAAVALRWIKISDIEKPQLVLATINQQYIQGLALQDGQMVVMLDLMRVLSGDAQSAIVEGMPDV